MAISPESRLFVQQLVRTQAGFELGDDKDYLIETRLEPLARQAAAPSVDAWLTQQRLRPTPVLANAIMQALLTTETSFFRDPLFFELLRLELLPAVIRLPRPDRVLRFWSAACSTGQEPYSLAMLLRDSFLPEPSDVSASITATDLCQRALDYAAIGRYTGLEVSRGLAADALLRHFRPYEGGWEVLPPLRRMVNFMPLNLIGPWPTWPLFDVILLRNMLIYTHPEAGAAILHRVCQQLRPGGFFCIGTIESLHRFNPPAPLHACYPGCYQFRP